MPKITFVLPVRGGSGGAHSVVQEVTALRDLGVEARVMVNAPNAAGFTDAYDRIPWIRGGGLEVFEGPKDIAARVAEAELVVATTNTSVHSVAEARKVTRGGAFHTAYYVQDYEPLFYSTGTIEHAIAVASFGTLPDCIYFAKTTWLTGIVAAAHGLDVKRVVPSIDHGLYRPARRVERTRRLVAAMVRPATPRRAPRRTLRVLSHLAAGNFGPVDIVAFGAGPEDVAAHGMALPEGVQLVGHLKQSGVAELLREADMFLDLSDYQAFGRTAAEAMACGCIALAPTLGGASDFIVDGVSGFMADTTDDEAIATAIRRMLSASESELRNIRFAGIEAVASFTPMRAAVSEMRAFGMAA